ncbi:MAG: MFS transporter [Kineosporiaceae bacterium]
MERLRTAAGVLAGVPRRVVRVVRRFTHARGAGESGLGTALELHLVASAADALVVTALAGTILFSGTTSEARGKVALSLLVTMVPFAVLAPVIGPTLDRFRRGRRYALATTMLVRAFLCWVMAGAVGGSGETGLGLYPAAFGFLVCQKAYLVTRGAMIPRVLPAGTDLVRANSRMSLAGVAAMAVGAPIGAGLGAWLGATWTLRLAFVVFAGGIVLALMLPATVDSAEGETPAALTAGGGRASWTLGTAVVRSLRANAALRAFTGFLTLFLAFDLRSHPVGSWSPATAVAAVLVMFGVGGGVGTALGGIGRRVRPELVTVVTPVVAAVAALGAALAYGLPAVLTVSAVAGLAQALGKLCLDAVIQRDVPDHARSSAFARSETLLQLAWVLGGCLGLVLPLPGRWGLALGAVAAVAGTVAVARSGRRPAATPPR